jgi:hypothetical protein
MLIKAELVPYLRKSLALQDPSIETDEAYKFTDDELYDVIVMNITEHNSEYTELNFPDNEINFLILLSKREIYFRLASSSAPFYPLQAEGAELRKDYRFEHYMSLIRLIDSEYESLFERFQTDQPVKAGDVLIASKHYTRKTYNLMSAPLVKLESVAVRDTSVDLQWLKFSTIGGMFYKYEIYVSKSEIYDEFEAQIDVGATKVVDILDIHRTKYRIKNLEPSTVYYALVVSNDTNGIKGYSQITFTTEPTPPTP